MVVEFTPEDGTPWVGNFQRNSSPLDAVEPEPGGDRVLVIAGGQAYLVDRRTRACVRTFGGSITDLLRHPDGFLVLTDGLSFEAFGSRSWQTRRVSWDGVRALRLEGETLQEEAFNPMGDLWEPFAIDLETGEATGGSYPVDLP